MGMGLRGALALAVLAVGVLATAHEASAQSAADKEKAGKLFQQGEAYFKAKAYDAAIEEYNKAYALVPKPGFLFDIGLCYEELGDKAKALEHYRRYLAKEPDGSAGPEARARSLKLQREIQADADAAAEAKKKAEADRERQGRIDEHIKLADAAATTLRYAEAIAEYRAAHKLSGDPEMLFRIGRVYDTQHKIEDAVAQYDAYVAAAPTGESAEAARERLRALRAVLAERAANASGTAQPIRAWRAWSVGLKLGVSANKPGFFTSTDSSCNDADRATDGPQVALSGGYAFSPSFGLQAELMYTSRSIESKCMAGDSNLLDVSAKVAYVLVPVTARLTRQIGELSLAIYAGPLVGLVVGDVDNNSAPDLGIQDRGGAVLGFATGLEMGIRMGPGRLFIDARFEGNNQTYEISGAGDAAEYSSEGVLAAMVGYAY